MKCIAIWYEEILSSSFCCKVPNNTWFPWFRNIDLSIPYINCSGRYMYILESFRINIYPDDIKLQTIYTLIWIQTI